MKKVLRIVLYLILAVIVVLVLYISFGMPNVGKAPDLKVEITPERVERGKYLATTVMSCVDCHSHRDFSKYAGPVTGDPFAGGIDEFTEDKGAPGNFYASNLTPYNLGNWTDGEIYRAITAGVKKDGKPIFPAMPYLLYGQASDEDIYSVIAYLRTLPPVESTVPDPEANFPFNIIMKMIPKKGNPQSIPPKSDLLAYGKYMTNIAGCVDCHTPQEKGQFVTELSYAGNMEFILPNGIVRSANITPDKKTGIGNWTEEMFISRFKILNDSTFANQDVSNFNTTMPWTIFKNMDEYDLKAIYTYLHSLAPIEHQVVRFTKND